jgi:hypothetical protein
MSITNFRLDVTTDASGNATAFSQGGVKGEVLQIRYTPDGTNPLATGSTATFTGEESGIGVLNKANLGTSAVTFAPRQPTHLNSDGSAALYAAAGTGVLGKIVLAGERLKLVIASGGNTLSGSFAVAVKTP